MENTQARGKRVAKNTLILYFRMLVTMFVGLYTSRVILHTLGVTDYGLNNVVGGVVGFFSSITGALAGTNSRYITFAIGKGNVDNVRKVFVTMNVIQLLIVAAVFVLAETIGLWFVLHKLTIPPDRMWACMWVYQLSLLSFAVSMLSVPYNSLIIAHERMGIYAYMSMLSVVLNLGVAFLLTRAPIDRLIFYSVLLLSVNILTRIIYTVYSKRHFPEAHFKLQWYGSLLREMFSYSMWSQISFLAVAGYTQGLNMIINMFFGPAVNAARAIAVSVQGIAVQFCANFQTAVNPQITKSFASGELSYMHQLVIYSSKLSFFIMMILGIPIIINSEYLITLWLGKFPEYTLDFVKITMCVSLLDTLKNPLLCTIHATGIIRKFQIVEGTLLILILPIAYISMKINSSSPLIVYYAYIFVEIITQMVRVWMIIPRISMSKKEYLIKAIIPISFVTLLCMPMIFLFKSSSSFLGLICTSIGYVAYTIIVILLLGLSRMEKKYVTSYVVLIYNKISK